MKKDQESLPERLLRGDYPNTRDGRKWKRSSGTFQRLCHYAKELRKLGMTPDQISNMFTDLYWDAFGEFKAMPVTDSKPAKAKRNIPYFDEFQIMFSLRSSEVTPDTLKGDYEFYCNAYAAQGTIWWTNSGGSAGGGPFHDFLNIVKLDNNYAFGPTKKQAGWPTEKLAELNAVGVYKRKEALVNVSAAYKRPSSKKSAERTTKP